MIHLLFTLLILVGATVVGNVAKAQSWQQLDSLGHVFTKQKKLKAADSVLQMALKKVEELHGLDTNYAKVAYALGQVYNQSGAYKKTEPLWLAAKQIRERALGKKHLLYARSCNGLGFLYEMQGLYDKAEPLYLEAKKIREDVLGKNHPDYAGSCNNLGILYNVQGLYDKAEAFHLEAKQIRESTLGKTHPEYALSCYNLATIYSIQGLYEKAELLYLEAKRIYEETVGKKHPDYARTCNNLAIVYRKQKLYANAEVLLLEAKTITEEIWGKKHPEYARLCNNLGNLYASKLLYEKAELFYTEAGRIWEEILGKKHTDYALVCSNLANLYLSQKLYDKATVMDLEAQQIVEEALGKKHPKYAASCYNLATINFTQRFYDKATPLIIESTSIIKDEINNLFPLFSEQEKLAYWQTVLHYFDALNQILINDAARAPSNVMALYNQALFTKGIIFSSTQKIKNTILNSGDTVLINQFNNWKKQRESYTKLYQLPLEEQKKQNLDLEGMKNQINDLEKDLSKKSALFGQNVQTKSYKWQEVQAKLAKNEAVIEIIKADSAYIVLFLTAQTENYPVFYVFKNIKDLEDKFLKYYKNCIEFKIEDTVSYNAFWKPIADKLLTLNKKGFKKIYLSPDGVFHQLSLNTLKNTKTGKFLLEEANIQLIGSSRDLIELNKKSRDLSQNYENYQAHLLGYPIYGAENTEKEPEKKRDRSLGFSGMQSAVGVAGSVSLLPGTKKEVENVFGLFNQKKLKVNLLLAENATEEAVKNLKSPTILHVATHGFFIPEIKDSEVQDMQTAMNRNLLKNPFLRSGLLLAGCQKPNPDKEDGILTAEEVMNLTLDNTELVVLSACETGLGDIQAGEGVFGLQRAFQQAGAKSVLMSLWKVDDEATQTLMTEFYTALLKGQSKRQAFKTAQMNLKKRFPEPYYWGAFVMVGE